MHDIRPTQARERIISLDSANACGTHGFRTTFKAWASERPIVEARLGPRHRRQALGSLHARRSMREAQALNGTMGNAVHNAG
jgi:hypothetical protein